MTEKKFEINSLFSSLRSSVTQNQIVSLHSRSSAKSLLAFTIDWGMILIGFYLCAKNIYLAPIGLILIGSRQRALSNLVHDASHFNLFSSKKMNDVVSNLLGAFPMLDMVEAYRRSHIMHHRFLGDEHLDPDSVTHARYGYNDRQPSGFYSVEVFFQIVLSMEAWKDSIIGGFLKLSKTEGAKILSWWIVVLVALTILGGLDKALYFTAIWFLSRATTYHFIRLFAEFLDHSGLPVSTTLKFTRNLPHTNPLAMIFHPHEDTYHLAHHIFMGVPHFKLKEAHSVLMNSDLYRTAHHCDSYFVGDHSAIACWMGKCGGGSK